MLTATTALQMPVLAAPVAPLSPRASHRGSAPRLSHTPGTSHHPQDGQRFSEEARHSGFLQSFPAVLLYREAILSPGPFTAGCSLGLAWPALTQPMKAWTLSLTLLSLAPELSWAEASRPTQFSRSTLWTSPLPLAAWAAPLGWSETA